MEAHALTSQTMHNLLYRRLSIRGTFVNPQSMAMPELFILSGSHESFRTSNESFVEAGRRSLQGRFMWDINWPIAREIPLSHPVSVALGEDQPSTFPLRWIFTAAHYCIIPLVYTRQRFQGQLSQARAPWCPRERIYSSPSLRFSPLTISAPSTH